jgi:hypothetical protein
MTELTIPFWLTSGWIARRAELPAWLKSQHIQPRWIDEEIIVSSTPAAEEPISPTVFFFKWPREVGVESLFLQQAAREIAAGDRRMILLSVIHPQGCRVVLLGSPAAVGMYNLMPQAYLTDWLALPPAAEEVPILSVLETMWTKRTKKPAQVKCLSLLLPGKRPTKAETVFKNAAWVKPEQPAEGGIGAAHALVQALLEKKQGNALLAEFDERQQLFSCWIEGV